MLDKGEVREFDTPAELVRRKGLFFELVREAGLVDANGEIRATMGGNGSGSNTPKK